MLYLFSWEFVDRLMAIVFQHKKTPRECLKVTDGTVPTECQVLRNTFFECKRSMVINLVVSFLATLLFETIFSLITGKGSEGVKVIDGFS